MLGGKISHLASFLPFRASVVLGSRKKSSEEWQAHVSKVYGGGTLPPGWEHLDGLRQMQQPQLPGKTRVTVYNPPVHRQHTALTLWTLVREKPHLC